MNTLSALLILAITAQAVAAIWVLTLIRLSGKALVWVALSAALVLMLGRRVLSLSHESGVIPPETGHILAEGVGVAASLLMIGVVYGLHRLFVERRRTQSALHLTQEKFDRLTASAQDAIVMLGPDGRVTFWNAAAERIFGYRAAETVGKMLHELIVPERFRESAERGIANFRQTGQGTILGKVQELPALRKDGTEFIAEHSIAALQLDGGWHAIGIVRDVSARKVAENKLQVQLDELRRFQNVAVDRELHVKALIEENERLKARLAELENNKR